MNPLAPVITVVAALLLVWVAMTADSSLLFQLYLAITSLFLVLLVLVQKGRGGGLAGALGGPGGSSAFGAKAGDVFTRITILAAVVWVIFAIGASYWASRESSAFGEGGGQLVRPPGSSESLPPAGSGATPPAPPAPEKPPTGPDLVPPTGSDTAPPTEAPPTEAPPAEAPAESSPATDAPASGIPAPESTL